MEGCWPDLESPFGWRLFLIPESAGSCAVDDDAHGDLESFFIWNTDCTGITSGIYKESFHSNIIAQQPSLGTSSQRSESCFKMTGRHRESLVVSSAYLLARGRLLMSQHSRYNRSPSLDRCMSIRHAQSTRSLRRPMFQKTYILSLACSFV